MKKKKRIKRDRRLKENKKQFLKTTFPRGMGEVIGPKSDEIIKWEEGLWPLVH